LVPNTVGLTLEEANAAYYSSTESITVELLDKDGGLKLNCGTLSNIATVDDYVHCYDSVSRS